MDKEFKEKIKDSVKLKVNWLLKLSLINKWIILENNGLQIWELLEYSNRMNFGNLAKWMKCNKNKYLSVICNKVNFKDWLKISMNN